MNKLKCQELLKWLLKVKILCYFLALFEKYLVSFLGDFQFKYLVVMRIKC